VASCLAEGYQLRHGVLGQPQRGAEDALIAASFASDVFLKTGFINLSTCARTCLMRHSTRASPAGVVRIWFLGRGRIRIRADPLYLITDISLS